MMHGKAIWKQGIGEIAKASRGIALWIPQGGLLQRPISTPSCNGQRSDTRCVTT